MGKEVYLYHETTAGIESKLDPDCFIRIHRSTIVNTDRIKELHPLFHGEYAVILHPMAGGVPLAKAWNCLQLYADKVLKPLGISVP